MRNQVNKYFVMPDAEQVSQTDRDRFIQHVMKGAVDKRGYCPFEFLRSGNVSSSDFSNQPVSLIGYEQMPDSRWSGQINPVFQRVIYQRAYGRNGLMVVHIDIVRNHPEIAGLKGLLIDKALLVRQR